GALHLAFEGEVLSWFQLEYAHSFAGDCEILPTGGAAGPLVIDLEGLSGRSRPSEVLQLLSRRGAVTTVMVRVEAGGAAGAFDL
ncbi:hypothetical protein ABTD78_22915, partial [Acinetobacter baumannii]